MARIILLDDEKKLLQTLARFLEHQGHQVIRGDRFSAIERHARPGAFELMVSDIFMPDFDGTKVLREVVEVRGCQEPVILITGEPNSETAADAVRRGAFDYISKPVTKDKLLEAVARGLRYVRMLRERDDARASEMQVLQRIAQIGESASALTHEIRTPVTSLGHALAAVGGNLGVGDRVLVEKLIGNLNEIDRLFGQALAYAKPLTLQRRPVEIDTVVADGIAAVSMLPGMRGVHIESSCPPGLVVEGDRELLGEALMTLLRDAGEACRGSGVVTVSAHADDRRTVVDVADDGPASRPSDVRTIWQPFRSTKESGSGIGLAFTRKVIESHGGTIVLSERLGGGSSFRIELPRNGRTHANGAP